MNWELILLGLTLILLGVVMWIDPRNLFCNRHPDREFSPSTKEKPCLPDTGLYRPQSERPTSPLYSPEKSAI